MREGERDGQISVVVPVNEDPEAVLLSDRCLVKEGTKPPPPSRPPSPPAPPPPRREDGREGGRKEEEEPEEDIR